MAAPYSYPPPPPSSGGGYYPPASPPSGGYNAPPPSGGYYPPPPSYSGAPVMSPGGIPPPPPTGNFGGMPARSMDPKARKERLAQMMVYSDIVSSSVSILLWVSFMAVFEWVYHHPYSLEILLPGGLVFLVPLVLDILIVAKKWLKNERMLIYWISGISLKMVTELVLIILFYVFVASKVSFNDPSTGTTTTRRRRNNDRNSTFWQLVFGLTGMVISDIVVCICGLVIMVIHLRFLRNPNPANGGPGGASQPLQPPPGIMG